MRLYKKKKLTRLDFESLLKAAILINLSLREVIVREDLDLTHQLHKLSVRALDQKSCSHQARKVKMPGRDYGVQTDVTFSHPIMKMCAVTQRHDETFIAFTSGLDVRGLKK